MLSDIQVNPQWDTYQSLQFVREQFRYKNLSIQQAVDLFNRYDEIVQKEFCMDETIADKLDNYEDKISSLKDENRWLEQEVVTLERTIVSLEIEIECWETGEYER